MIILPQSWFDKYCTALAISFVSSAALTFLSIHLFRRLGVMDAPDERKIHKAPVPRMGGIAIFIGFVLPLLFMLDFSGAQEGIIIGSFLALLIGAADDIWRVPAHFKLLFLFLITFLIWHFGVVTNLPFVFENFRSIFNLGLTMLWLAGVCSAINALDHMDGLAGGIAAIASFAYLAVSLQTAQWVWGMLAISLAGSLLGFLVFNRHPAKIFMGDSGSFFLGFSLGAIGIMGGWSENSIKSAVIPFAVLSIPVMDLLYVIVNRRVEGTTKSIKESIIYCGKDHIGHRFCDLGFSQVNSVRIIYLVSITVSVSALVIRQTGHFESCLLLAQIFLLYFVIFILMRHPGQEKAWNK